MRIDRRKMRKWIITVVTGYSRIMIKIIDNRLQLKMKEEFENESFLFDF